MRRDGERIGTGIRELLRILGWILYVVGALAAFFLMVAIFFIGFHESGWGILVYFGRGAAELHGMTPESKAL